MLLDSWQEHDLLECVAKAAPSNAGEGPRQQYCKSIPIEIREMEVTICDLKKERKLEVTNCDFKLIRA